MIVMGSVIRCAVYGVLLGLLSSCGTSSQAIDSNDEYDPSRGLDTTPADVERGARLFRDPALSGSRNDKSCWSCHEHGEGLERAHRPVFRSLFGLRKRDLGDVINWCITEPLQGQPLAKDSPEMRDLAAYVKTFGKP